MNGVERLGACFLAVSVLFPVLSSARPEHGQDYDFEHAKSLLNRREWAEAAALLKKLVRTTRGAPELAIAYSTALFHQRKREEAVKALLESARQERGAARDQLQRRARVLSRQFYTNGVFQTYQDGLNLLLGRRYREAREKLERALQSEPDNVEAVTRYAQCLTLDGEFGHAVGRLRSVQELDPEEPEVRLWLGRALHLRGDPNLAVVEIRAARQGLPDSDTASLWLAEALVAAGQKQAAFQSLEREVRKHPFYLQSSLLLTRLKLLAAGQDAQALAALRRDVQILLSRIEDSPSAFQAPAEPGLSLDLRDPAGLKSEATALFQRVDSKLKQKDDSS